MIPAVVPGINVVIPLQVSSWLMKQGAQLAEGDVGHFFVIVVGSVVNEDKII